MASEFENAKQAEPTSRIQRKQLRSTARAERIEKQSQEKQVGKAQNRPTKTRLIPIWLRLLIVVFLLVLSTTVGLMFGYGVIGDGTAFGALKFSTWQHLVDLVLEGTKTNS